MGCAILRGQEIAQCSRDVVTSFWLAGALLLPSIAMEARSSEQELAAYPAQAVAESGPSRLPSRALVVDDSMVVADVVTALLRRTGWMVDVANTVDAALEHVRALPYHLLASDLCMPPPP